MARPRKCKKVCCLPENQRFDPVIAKGDPVVLAVEEYEALRVLDYRGFSQEQCAALMGVARTTVQQIYDSARRKMVRAMVESRPLVIEGGCYQLCDGAESQCICGGCTRHLLAEAPAMVQKEEKIMRIAVPFENGQVFQHFGHTEQFKIYDTEDGQVVNSLVLPTNGSGHGALSGFLKSIHVDVLLCGGIGGGARTALADMDIKLYPGVMGEADAAVAAFLSDTLSYDPDHVCAHHDHGADHDCSSHDCGSHSCGSHSCGNH